MPGKTYKVFINSNFREKSFEKSNDFTFYVRPSLEGVNRLKVRSCSIPMTQYTFEGLTEEQRTFNAHVLAADHVTRRVSKIFETTRNYTRSDFVAALNDAFKQAQIDVTVTGSTEDGSAIEFVNNLNMTVFVTAFPAICHNMTLPFSLSAAGGTVDVNTDKLFYESQVIRTFPLISKFRYTEKNKATGASTVATMSVSDVAILTASAIAALLNGTANIGGGDRTWSVSGANQYHQTISCSYGGVTYERDVKLEALTSWDETPVLVNKAGLRGVTKTISNGAASIQNFSTDCNLTSEAMYPSAITGGSPTAHVSFTQGTIYNVNTLIAAINTAYGSTIASVVSANDYRITNPSSTLKMKWTENVNLGVLSDTELAVSGSHDFKVEEWRHNGAAVHTGHLDFGSRTSKVCYLSLPSMIYNSRCHNGHQSIATSIINTSNSVYGSYATRTDDSDSYYLTAKSEIDEVKVRILDENHNLAELGDLPIFLELEFTD